jgi:peptidoglycan/LPS O-acetylase OafA/YrhL
MTRDATATHQGVAGQAARHEHLYELDMLRVVTAFGVVAVHVLALTVMFNTSRLGVLIQHGAEASLHFTREAFMFTTALVLVYTYMGKPCSLTTFARKRGIGVVVPYVVWSAIYVLHGPHPATLPPLLSTLAVDIVSGNASFQLYYILLTIQFYLLFPLLLILLPLLDRHRWLVLGVSAALEVVILALDYHVVQVSPVAATPLGAWFDQYQDRFVLLYQFYFVLGALCALHLHRLRAFTLQHGRLIGVLMAATVLAYCARYAYVVGVAHGDVDRAIAVLQPIVVPYSVAAIAFLWWIACRWAWGGGSGAAPRARPAGSAVWRTLADASFGIYLVHPLFITFAIDHVAPKVPAIVPEPARVALVWLIAVAGSSALTVTLMRTPLLSRLVGRATPLPPALVLRLRTVSVSMRDWVSAGRRAIAEVLAPRGWTRGSATASRPCSVASARAIADELAAEGAGQLSHPPRLEQPLHSAGAGAEHALRGSGA